MSKPHSIEKENKYVMMMMNLGRCTNRTRKEQNEFSLFVVWRCFFYLFAVGFSTLWHVSVTAELTKGTDWLDANAWFSHMIIKVPSHIAPSEIMCFSYLDRQFIPSPSASATRCNLLLFFFRLKEATRATNDVDVIAVVFHRLIYPALYVSHYTQQLRSKVAGGPCECFD